MDGNYDEVIGSLKVKISRIVSLYESAVNECNRFEEENKELKIKLKKNENDYSDLSKKFETLKIARSVLASEEDSHEAKIKVNRIVREIDKCLALLNK